jgi:hypothetical protein
MFDVSTSERSDSYRPTQFKLLANRVVVLDTATHRDRHKPMLAAELVDRIDTSVATGQRHFVEAVEQRQDLVSLDLVLTNLT